MRTTGIDILVIILDHDPIMMRGHMLKAVTDRQVPLTDTLISLLQIDPDLGVKNQLADALKVLLDPAMTLQELFNRVGQDFVNKLRGQGPLVDPSVVQYFEDSARKLFLPLKQLESRPTRELPMIVSTVWIFLLTCSQSMTSPSKTLHYTHTLSIFSPSSSGSTPCGVEVSYMTKSWPRG